ncbi:relaxase [Marivibrio halodurans]|uniref:Relaxase n=1 Tax=Marivibrio halodurans TaxID=2039722 RepID=A0A8J7SQ60_9PROT|nr:relaxase [Marivibrio halodurans]MBP5858831.1 relaxase [Marivibrio halodurans]
MILVGNPRGGARDLARHLMKAENERVEVAELRGFVADDLDGAFQESYAISRGTKCRQFLFSLSLNPPKEAQVSAEDFSQAIDRVETKLGLTGQPRAIVYHEKRGDDGEVRRHAHAVWSRIDVQEMKAIPLPHSKRKMQDIARDLYLEHGWTMPRGLAVSGARDPRNFTLAEWQQARRIKEDPREIKAAFQDAWAISDSKAAFTHALQERGYWLARGDQRGHVAVDRHGEVHNIAKRVGVKTKDVRSRLDDETALPSVADTKREIAKVMQEKMKEFQREVGNREERERKEAEAKRKALKERQDKQRQVHRDAARRRQKAEEEERQARLRGGLLGLWDRIRGERKRTLERNAQEAEAARSRDKAQRDTLTAVQLAQRREAVKERTQQRERNKAVTRDLTEDAKVFQKMETETDQEREARREAFKEKRRRQERERPRRRSKSRGGPSLDRR